MAIAQPVNCVVSSADQKRLKEKELTVETQSDVKSHLEETQQSKAHSNCTVDWNEGMSKCCEQTGLGFQRLWQKCVCASQIHTHTHTHYTAVFVN